MTIASCAVLGAGTMGSGIAAHLANAGIPVLLLDMVPKAGADRNAVARGAIERMGKTEPAPLMSAEAARLITPGNFEDDLPRLAGVDWIIEAIVEDPGIKRGLYARIDAVRKPGSVVTSNTSTIPLRVLLDGQSDAFRADFAITHFFNPPRYMRLLEIVQGPETRPEVIAQLTELCDRRLGKGVVTCKDTPGFIANRIGTYWSTVAIAEAFAQGISIEEADAMHGPMGVPRTGVFALMDLVGLDLIPLISKSMLALLPPADDYRRIHRDHALIGKMLAEGYTGRKGRGGFYRVNRAAGGAREAIDLATGEYRPSRSVRDPLLEGDLKALVQDGGRLGRYSAAVLVQLLAYAAGLVPEIADDITAVDEAMRLGYGWKSGPFELIDRIGPDLLADLLQARGMAVPPLLLAARGRSFYRVQDGRLEYLAVDGTYQPLRRPEGVLLLADIKRAGRPVARNGSAALWDIGAGVLCLEFTGKMNAIDPDVIGLLARSLDLVGKGGHKGLVIYNEGENFSVGANLGIAMFAANIAAWDLLADTIATGQKVYKAMKYAPFPVVGAPAGMALGGGCEILLHCAAVQAHAETYMGLVEVGVGLLPGWGGCKELLARWQAMPGLPRGPMPAVARSFELISTAQVSKSAAQAREFGFLRATDGITMNRDRLLFDARAKVLALAEKHKAPEPATYRLPGPSGAATLAMAVAGYRAVGRATSYDVEVAREVAQVLTGGEADPQAEITEDDISQLERSAFLRLIRQPGTIARIEHMLATGKPLRN